MRASLFLLLSCVGLPRAWAQDRDDSRRTWIADLQGASGTARRVASDKLIADGAIAVPLLLPLLAHPVHDVRRTAAGVLAGIGAPAVAGLVQALERAPEEPTRKAAALALRRIGNPAVAPLLEVIRRRDPSVVPWASWALRPEAPSVVPVLVAALVQEPPNADLRDAAIAGLAHLGPAAVPALLPLLKSPRPHVRHSAASALCGHAADASAAIPRLIELLSDANGRVALAAVDALVAIGPPAIDSLVALLEEVHDVDPRLRRVERALTRIGSPATGSLLRCRQGGEPARSRAFEILRAIEEKASTSREQPAPDDRLPAAVVPIAVPPRWGVGRDYVAPVKPTPTCGLR